MNTNGIQTAYERTSDGAQRLNSSTNIHMIPRIRFAVLSSSLIKWALAIYAASMSNRLQKANEIQSLFSHALVVADSPLAHALAARYLVFVCRSRLCVSVDASNDCRKRPNHLSIYPQYPWNSSVPYHIRPSTLVHDVQYQAWSRTQSHLNYNIGNLWSS